MRRAVLALLLSAGTASAQRFTRAQQDVYHRIAGITTAGDVVWIAPVGRYADVRLSDDKRTVLWLATSELRDSNRVETVSYRIGWYRDGRRREYSANGQFVRHTWLVDSGRKIGVNYGGLHFAGRNVLLDARTGKQLDSFADQDKTKRTVPGWVR